MSFLAVSFALALVSASVGITSAQTCATTIVESSRIDCNVRPNTQANCEAVGCVWCPNVGVKIAKCFINNTDPLSVVTKAATHCHSTSNCKIALNCHPDIKTYQPTQASCESRSCLWLGSAAVDDQPRCVYYNNTLVVAKGSVSPAVDLNKLCSTCAACTVKVNCLPNEPSFRITQNRCIREGCLWCPTDNKCYQGGQSGLQALLSVCIECDQCPLHAYIKASTQAICTSRGAHWCPSRPSSPEDRRCIPHLTHPGGGACTAELVGRENCKSCTDCAIPIDCSTSTSENQTTCEAKKCLWCYNATDDKPNCRYKVIPISCTKQSDCNLQFPRFQKISFTLVPHQRPHLMDLMRIFCFTQMGVWDANSADKCLSPTSYLNSPIERIVNRAP